MYIFTPESTRVWWDHFVVFLYVSVDLPQYLCYNLFQMLSLMSYLAALFLADHRVSVEGSSLFSWTTQGQDNESLSHFLLRHCKILICFVPTSVLVSEEQVTLFSAEIALLHSWLTRGFSFQLLLDQFFPSLPWNSSPSPVVP